jgi:uncharacterized membrane protein (Fun14 family)
LRFSRWACPPPAHSSRTKARALASSTSARSRSPARWCASALWAFAPRLKFRTAAGIFVGLLIFSAFLLASRGVLTVGYAAVDLLAILSATLFFGRPGAVVGMCASSGAHLTGWAIVAFELGRRPRST